MRYKRDEAFRFEFDEPIPITFTIDKINGIPVNTSEGAGKMLDLSLGGMKIATTLSLPVNKENEIGISIHFTIVQQLYSVQGKLVWKKVRDSENLYGIQFLANSSVQKAILRDLKLLRKQMVNLERI
ncbi:PilZ domain-containing protein [Ornithinibacillus halotolerans]|uniref:PilZ domain-containing protein n=1 Tax=Ornithinibacillus halotolerans TaxID=1274357 RepID=A0A916W865_9BACI|nr:PilZ domain-containing protein [Ornithinibacillus halotolerans]GGA77080.1 hypothetical protein GCM10008025_20870 [Ornithinibacillus halotolerans]